MEPLRIPRRRGNLVDSIFAYLDHLRPSDGLLLKVALLSFFGFLVWTLVAWSTGTQVEISSPGGHLTEGVVGTPRFVNPVLAVTRADRDMSALIYDGLMRLGADGTLVPNIAESITVSEDGLTYHVTLRGGTRFHDGTELTSDDVIFTIARIQDPALSSPLRASFDGVSIEQLGPREFNIVLTEAYAPFIENLTFGIIPRHIWKDASNEEFPFSQHNSEPIGSGPYQIEKITRNTSGIPQSYILTPYTEYHLGAPQIGTLTLKFYGNEDKLIEAFTRGEIDSVVGIDQEHVPQLAINPETHHTATIPLPRTFALFFNQNKSAVLRDSAVREALDISINRTALIDQILGGYGQPLSSPIPPGFGIEANSVSTEQPAAEDEARAILRNAGWKLNADTGIWEKEIDGVTTPLAFSIATVNNAVFEATAEFLRTEWERLGISVTIKQFEQSDLTQAIIRPRDYEALLFGTDVGRSLDFYSFWHSSQRNDPGLNVALYANIKTDAILSEARKSTTEELKQEALLKFVEEINAETPALFLYSPELLYIFPTNVTGAKFTGLSEPSERFASIHEWFINTESVWPFFGKTHDTAQQN